MSEELAKIMGTCKHCGQSRIIKTEGEVSQDQADEIASEECDCPGAKVEHNRKSKINKANEWAEQRFENNPEVLDLFREVFSSVTNNEVEKVSIKVNQWTHNIFLDSDGYLNVKSSKKVEEEVDFS